MADLQSMKPGEHYCLFPDGQFADGRNSGFIDFVPDDNCKFGEGCEGSDLVGGRQDECGGTY